MTHWDVQTGLSAGRYLIPLKSANLKPSIVQSELSIRFERGFEVPVQE